MNGDTRGMTSVIGIILLVAITVIVAAVAGAYIWGFETDTAVAPQAAWEDTETFNDDGDLETLTLTHNGGDAIDSETITVYIDGDEVDESDDRLEEAPSGDITAGDGFDFEFEDDNLAAGTEIWLIWEDPDPDSDETRILLAYELGSDTA